MVPTEFRGSAPDPSILKPSAREYINLRAIGQIDSGQMMKALTSRAYSTGTYDPTGGDGFIRGTWRQIEDALVLGLITDEEYEQIAREAPSSWATRTTD